MSTFNHTPDSWEVGYCSPDRENGETFETLAVFPSKVLVYGKGIPICKVSPAHSVNDTDIANAKLLAAAPDLLEACIEALRALDLHDKFGEDTEAREQAEIDAHHKLISAIEKATT